MRITPERKLPLTLASLLLVACTAERTPTAPNSIIIAPASVIASATSNGIDRSTYRVDLPFGFTLLRSDLPCLSEDIQLSGTLQEHMVFIEGADAIHLTVHQTTNNVTAVGLSTGDRYAFSGPLTFTASGTSLGGNPAEFSFHNINHFVGPGPDANIMFHTVIHVTFDQVTGEVKAVMFKDEVRC